MTQEVKKEQAIRQLKMEIATDYAKLENKELTAKEKHVLQGYVEACEKAIAEHKPKSGYPALTWENIDKAALKKAVYVNSKLGLDMWQDNCLHVVPFYNDKTKIYTLNFLRGYNGIRDLALKYSREKIVNLVIELVYSNDEFIPLKKSINNPVESYEFNIKNPFNRGKVVGGFGYIEFANKNNNKLIILSKAEMDKRKPEYASVEFWGGEKNVWENKKIIGKEHVEGWEEEMLLKTLIRNVCNQRNIPLDTTRVGELFYQAEQLEEQAQECLNNSDDIVEVETVEAISDTDILPPTDEIKEEVAEHTEPEKNNKKTAGNIEDYMTDKIETNKDYGI